MLDPELRAVASPRTVYCHAGAFVLGNLDTDHRQCVELARRGRCSVVSVEYRLAPEHPYPAALEDCQTVLRWLVANAAALAVGPGRRASAARSSIRSATKQSTTRGGYLAPASTPNCMC